MIPRVSDVRKLSEPKEMLAKENMTLTTCFQLYSNLKPKCKTGKIELFI